MDYEEIQRLKLLLERADNHYSEAANELDRCQEDAAIGRVGYFDRLTIGSGAAIAAIVSFLGTHSTTLHPVWILRVSLIALVLAMTAALYRNYRYPNYVLQMRKVIWMKAARNQQQCKHNYLMSNPAAISIQTGDPIDIAKWTADYNESDTGLDRVITDGTKNRERLQNQWAYAERICLASICIAMISLVWLALCNF